MLTVLLVICLVAQLFNRSSLLWTYLIIVITFVDLLIINLDTHTRLKQKNANAKGAEETTESVE